MNEDEVSDGYDGFDGDFGGNEEDRPSLVAFADMARADMRPDFLGGAQSQLRQGERKAAGGLLKTGLNAISGGTAGTALSAAEKAGAAAGKAGAAAEKASAAMEQARVARAERWGQQNVTNSGDSQQDDSDSLFAGRKKKGLLSGKGKLKMLAAAPLILIFGVIILVVVALSFAGQALFVEGVKAELDNHWNSTETASTAATDNFTDSVQLGGNDGSLSDTIFDRMGFTEEEKASFKEQGLDIKEYGDSAAAFTYTDTGGNVQVIVSSGSIGKLMNGEVLASDNSVTYDGGAEGMSEEEAKQAIIDELGIAANTENVKTFADAMSGDRTFRQAYKRATEYWRGGISGWFNDMTETVRERLGISRNNFKDWTNESDELANQKKLTEFAASKPAAVDGEQIGGQSLMEQAKEIATQSRNPVCGTSSAFNGVESVVAADQTARQVSAASLFLESIDKTRAGKGEEAPLNSMMNIFFDSGGAQTESIYSLFSHTTVNQANELVQKASAQAHGNNESILSQTNSEEYRSCMYVGNTNQMDNGGAVVEVGSLFKPFEWIINGIVEIARRILSFFGIEMGGGSGSQEMAVTALTDTVSQYEQMQGQKYITGDDTALLGEGIISGAERIYNEKAKSGGQTIGDNDAVKLTYRAQQDIIAEQAEYDRATKSPFDTSSQYTFLGSIARSLVPFATSSGSLNLKTTLTNMGSAVSNALTNLLPTSQAAGELDISRGDCVFSNNIGGVSNPHCNNYYNSDLTITSTKKPKETYQAVWGLRFDEAGYVYGTDENGTTKAAPNNDSNYGGGGLTQVGKGSRESTDVADWGDGPLNVDENGLPYHWAGIVNPILSYPHLIIHGSKSQPNGCESDWYHYYVDIYDAEGNYLYTEWHYFFDQPNQWSYSRATNFEYGNYQSGWHNRTSEGNVGLEMAKNLEEPGECLLDLAKTADGQPVINQNGALGMYILASGQRTAEWGVTDEFALDRVLHSDFTKGRLHPCFVGSDECGGGIYKELGWWDGRDSGGGRASGQISDDFKKNTANSAAMSRWIGGSAYVYYNSTNGMASFGSMNTAFSNDERFKDPTIKDPTMGSAYFWNENLWYQNYVETLEWMENTGMIGQSSATLAVRDFYEENPLDQSYEGIIARYSGMNREDVVAVVDLLEYIAYLEEYNEQVAELGPLAPLGSEKLDYSGDEVVIIAERIIQGNAVVYDELRNKTVAA